MAVKPRKSAGGNTSMNGGAKTPDNKRKSLPKPQPVAATPNKKPAPTPATPVMAKKQEKASPEKKPAPEKKPQGISAQLAKVSDQSKAINKKHHQKKNKGKQQKGQQQGNAPNQQQKQTFAKVSKNKNRRQRLQAKLSAKPRSPLSQSRALKAEQEMNQNSPRILIVKLPDQPLSKETILGWSTNIESALFTKPVEPRSFTVVLKPDADVKKEMDKLKKISFGGGKLTIEEKKINYDVKEKDKADGISPADLIDPYTLYLTNLDDSATRDDLQELFSKAKTVMSPKKHNPRVAGTTGTGTKFAFVSFDTAEEALEAFKMSFNKKFINGRCIVVRFRRIAKSELPKKEEKKVAPAASAVAVKRKADEATPAKTQVKKEEPKKKLVKVEPKEEVEEEDEDDDEGEDIEEEEDENDDDEEMEEAEDDDDDEDGLDDEDDDEDDDDDDDDDE